MIVPAFDTPAPPGPLVAPLWPLIASVARQRYPDAVCILGELRFDLAARCIGSDSAYDVATFRIEADEVDKFANYANGKAFLTGSQLW